MRISGRNYYSFLLILVVLLPILLMVTCKKDYPTVELNAVFVGSENCKECHEKAYDLWLNSDHDMAMDTVNDQTVLGDFNDVTYKARGFTNRFYKKGDEFWVYTRGPEGKPADYKIDFVFGVRPLQQYLIKFEKGRVQCLPIAWDTEKKQWFDIYQMIDPTMEIESDDWLYWTNNAQSWNSMCAECHSTDLQKNYDPETREFNTTWSEIHVGCEACHGPGSNHVRWGKIDEKARPEKPNYDLTIQTSNVTSKQFVNNCAYCHARRSSLDDFIGLEGDNLNHFIPELITEPNYHPDGQILEEVYVYGSFTQSKMYNHHVSCKDCHDSHSLQLKFEGNALCLQCHVKEDYDTYDHHFHKAAAQSDQNIIYRDNRVENGDGTQCISCHMTGAYFMGNDYRRDHSFRSPRPDLSIQYGTPNACTGCHDDQTDKWALEYVQKWYEEDPPEHYSTYLSRLQREEVALRADLDSLLADSTPVIIQASSLAIVGAYQSPEYLDVFEAGLKDKNAVIRQAAVRFYYHQDEQVLKRKMIGMLRDSVLGIRIEAALKLGRSSLQPEGEEDIKLFESATAELIDAMEHSADFQTTNHNLATFYSGLGDAVKAEKYFKEAIRIDNRFYPAQINLALLYNGQKRNAEAEMVLKEVVDKNPDVPDGPYYLGLLLTEAGRMDEAIEYFEMTTKLTPDNPRVFYNLGLACQQVNKPVKAEKALARAMEIAPHNPEYIYALIYFYMQNGNKSKAKKWALTMTERFPNIPAGREILREIER